MRGNGGEIHVVRADLRHLETLTVLFDGYRQFYRQGPDKPAARNYLDAHIRANDCVVYLALDQAETGAGFVLLYPTWDSVDLASYWILHDLYVAPEFRRHGVGGKLMQEAEQCARRAGASRLDLGTAVDNNTAQSLYESRGWQRDQQFYRYSLVLE